MTPVFNFKNAFTYKNRIFGYLGVFLSGKTEKHSEYTYKNSFFHFLWVFSITVTRKVTEKHP